MSRRKLNCAVVGTKGFGPKWNDQVAKMAEVAGRIATECGFLVMTGGGSGVMEYAAKGAVEAGGDAVGILPAGEFDWGNEWNTIVIPTSIGFARNVITAAAADVMIALPGRFGTMQEITFAIERKKPILSWQSWIFDEVDCMPDDVDSEVYLRQWLLRHKN
jgi:uncharacterized protein (TIGR00725 family)